MAPILFPKLPCPQLLAGFAALKPGLTSTVRYRNVDYPAGFAPGQFGGWNDSALSYAANLFWSPAKGFDLGVEYRHGQRELVSGSKGQLDRLEFTSKYSF